MAKRTKTSIMKSLDRLWSRFIRNRDPYCCKCGKPSTEAHHIFGRRNMATRWDIENGIGLCSYCHEFSSQGFEQAPYNADNLQVLYAKLGVDRLNALEQRHYQVVKFTVEDLLSLENKFKAFIKIPQ